MGFAVYVNKLLNKLFMDCGNVVRLRMSRLDVQFEFRNALVVKKIYCNYL